MMRHIFHGYQTGIFLDILFICEFPGYQCSLYLNDTEKLHVDFSEKSDVTGYSLYLYQSAITGYAYQVVLVEAEQERGSSWYYTVVFKNNELINAFFIDRGMPLIVPTEDFLTQYPDADEMYIDLNEVISIFIDDDHKIIFKLNEVYLYPENDSTEVNKGVTCIERALN